MGGTGKGVYANIGDSGGLGALARKIADICSSGEGKGAATGVRPRVQRGLSAVRLFVP